MLNQDTLLLVQICITALTTALLGMAALYASAAPEQRWWALGNVICSVGLAICAAEGLPLLVHGVLGYGVIGLGMALVLRGLRMFRSELLGWRGIALLVAPLVLLIGYFTVVEPSLRGRLSVSGFYFGVLNWTCAVTLARHGDWRGICPAVLGFTLLGLALFTRGVFLLFHSDLTDYRGSLVLGLVMLVIPLAQVCVTFGVVLMVMRRYAERLRNLSWVDALTGALNRAGLEAQGRRVALRSLRAGRSLTAVMLDADHFKQVNDNHGHPAGDAVLRHLAAQIKGELRPMDLLARYGGEEFVLLLDGTGLDDGVKVAERLRQKIELELVDVGANTVRYTASLGVVCSDQHGYDLNDLIAAGDMAMYAAKRAGRNQVKCG